jgi:hypothetical protein
MFGSWKQNKEYKKDGYNLGNGKVFMISGLGKKILRNGKPEITEEDISRTNIPVIVGPFYTSGSLAYGFEVIHTDCWQSEDIIIPLNEKPFWGIKCENSSLIAYVEDMIMGALPAFVRTITIQPKSNQKIEITIPIQTDSRNAKFVWQYGDEVKSHDILYRSSIDEDKLVEEFEEHLLFRAAPRRIFQDLSNNYPIELPARFMTIKAVADIGCKYVIKKDSIIFHIENTDKNKLIKMGIIFATGIDSIETLNLAKQISENSVDEIRKQAEKTQRELLLTPINAKEDDQFARLMRGSVDLLYATLAEYGGNFAQGCMYPMNYVRDQYGSVRHFEYLQDYKNIRSILEFYIAMENKYGIQNSHDPSPTWMDSSDAFWDKKSIKDGNHKIAEIPSYIIIFAETYYRMTGDLEYLKSVYERLRNNIYCQEFSDLMLLASPGDESYTQLVGIERLENFADSNLLFLKACKFMIELAEKLDIIEDKENFTKLYNDCKQSIKKYLWDDEKKYIKASKDLGKGVTDVLLRPFWLRYYDLGENVNFGCLEYALKNCINPIRVIEDVESLAAGMDIAYFLTALSASQHPLMVDCAKLLCEYTSESGLISEYYGADKNKYFHWISGNERPWETGCAAAAFYDYALGMCIDLSNKKISFKPHIPVGWDGYKTKEIFICNEGYISANYIFDGVAGCFFISRKGGLNSFILSVEIGGFKSKLEPISNNISKKTNNCLISSLKIDPDSEIVYKFITKNLKN